MIINYNYNSIEAFYKQNKNDYKYVVVDISTIIVPYLNRGVYFNSKGINVTSSYIAIDFILKLKNIFRNSIIVVVFDNGQTINSIATYKSNRNKNQYRNIYLNKNNYNNYLYNVGLINEFVISTYNISSIEEGEADFKIPYIIRKIREIQSLNKINDILTISADSDLISTYLISDVLLMRYKYDKNIKKKVRHYYYVNKNTINSVCKDVLKTNNVVDLYTFLLYKILVGDKTDNVQKIISVKKFDNFMEYLFKTYPKISDLFINNEIFNVFINDYCGIKSEAKKQQLLNQLLINYYQINNLNSNLLSNRTKEQINRFLDMYYSILYRFKNNLILDIDENRIKTIFTKMSLTDEDKVKKYITLIKKLFGKNYIVGGS